MRHSSAAPSVYGPPSFLLRGKVVISSNPSQSQLPSVAKPDSEESSEALAPVPEDTSFQDVIAQVTPTKPDPQLILEMLLTYRSICGTTPSPTPCLALQISFILSRSHLVYSDSVELVQAILKRFKDADGPEANDIRKRSALHSPQIEANSSHSPSLTSTPSMRHSSAELQDLKLRPAQQFTDLISFMKHPLISPLTPH